MRTLFSFLVAAALVAATAPVAGHHAFGAEFDPNAPIRLQGKVVKLEWVNPHAWIHIEVKKPDGTAEVWMVEGGTPNTLLRRGLTRESLTVGTELRSGQNAWKVVGVFEADGGVAETEIWCDARVLQGAYRRGSTYQTVLAQLDSADSFNTFRDWLTSNPQLNVQVLFLQATVETLPLPQSCRNGAFTPQESAGWRKVKL